MSVYIVNRPPLPLPGPSIVLHLQSAPDMLPTVLVLGLLAPLASGHGVMVVPPSWFEVKGESGEDSGPL